MKNYHVELAVGIFMIAGILCLAYIAVRLGDVDLFERDQYQVHAVFSDTGGLNVGAPVVIAGVRVGEVVDIHMENYQGKVTMMLPKNIELREDAMAAVKTRGLIGEKYVGLSPGGADRVIQPGGTIRDTQPAVDFEEIISQAVFDKL